MSVGCQGQGKTCAAFRRLWKPWGPRAVPGSPPSLPRPPCRTWEKWEHKAPARQVRREDNCEEAALGPTRQEALPPWSSPPTESCSPEAAPQWGPEGLAGHRRRCHYRASGTWWTARSSPGASSRAFAVRSAEAGSPHRYSRPAERDALSRDSKGTARELVLHGGPGPYRAVR